MNAVDQIFAEAEGLPWMWFDLPAPPSVNQFMGKLGNKTPVVQKWIRQADMAFMVAGGKRTMTQLKCLYEAQYIFGPHTGDLSNRVKPLEDWLQRVGIIENDRDCRKFVCEWAADLGLNVPKGRVIVRLRPWMIRA